MLASFWAMSSARALHVGAPHRPQSMPGRTDCHALPTVNTEVTENPCLSSGDADGFGRAALHAVCTTLAFLFNDMQRVVKGKVVHRTLLTG
jgi:hypothetical protein